MTRLDDLDVVSSSSVGTMSRTRPARFDGNGQFTIILTDVVVPATVVWLLLEVGLQSLSEQQGLVTREDYPQRVWLRRTILGFKTHLYMVAPSGPLQICRLKIGVSPRSCRSVVRWPSSAPGRTAPGPRTCFDDGSLPNRSQDQRSTDGGRLVGCDRDGSVTLSRPTAVRPRCRCPALTVSIGNCVGT